MSNLLEEAIVDAKALKEAAMKTAEKSIVEKYSDEVKSQISKILEAEMDMDNAVADNPLEKIPLAALDGETSTDADEEIEIDLSDLADMAAQENLHTLLSSILRVSAPISSAYIASMFTKMMQNRAENQYVMNVFLLNVQMCHPSQQPVDQASAHGRTFGTFGHMPLSAKMTRR